jgi:hypothetical protein
MRCVAPQFVSLDHHELHRVPLLIGDLIARPFVVGVALPKNESSTTIDVVGRTVGSHRTSGPVTAAKVTTSEDDWAWLVDLSHYAESA